MSLRFNGGYGAYTCDGCRVIMREGGLKQFGEWNHVLVEKSIVIVVGGRTLEFCKPKCIKTAANDRNEDVDVRDACRRWLAERDAR